LNTSLSRILPFVALILLGLALLPKLPFQLQPGRSLPSLTVSYQWPDASAELLEQQATSKLEALFATLRGLKKISSTTQKGQGSIRLEFDKSTDLDFVRFEVSALIRQARPRLPQPLSYPLIRRNRPRDEADPTLMSYTLNGPVSPYYLRQYAEEQIQPRLALIQGIHQLQLYGATPYAWELRYRHELLRQLGLQPHDIASALQRALFKAELGQAAQAPPSPDGDHNSRQVRRLVLETPAADSLNWAQVPIKRVGNRMLYLTDVVEVSRRERPPHSYHRINGLNTINLLIKAESSANHLQLAAAIKNEVQALRAELPPGYSLILTYDSTTFLREELEKIGWRSLFSVLILLLFVWVVSRSLRYLGVILFSLLANLAIASLFYQLLGLEMHLYSLAGITVSLGLIIDNSIVMIDHWRREGNRSVFVAILAATLTTLGALSVIFFLEEQQRLQLQDFAWVMMINLAVSLAVALWLIPALHPRQPTHQPTSRPLMPWLRKRLSTISPLILHGRAGRLKKSWNRIHKPLLITIAILGFGLPVFYLPDKWESEALKQYYGPQEEAPALPWYMQAYNRTLGNRYYVQNIKPWVNKLLGGSLRLFVQETYPNARYRQPERTALYVYGQMPYGSTVHQVNEIFQRLENFLAQYEEVQQFQTEINSPQSARMIIHFKPEYERGSFPYLLKSRVERFAIDQGAVDWQVYGVGRGFSNAIGLGSKNSRIALRGYNYNELLRHANRLKDSLLHHPRIKEVFLNGQIRWDYRPNYEYLMQMDRRKLAQINSSPRQVFEELQRMSLDERPLMYVRQGGRYEQLVLKPAHTHELDLWALQQTPLRAHDSLSFKLSEVARLVKEPAGDIIYREDQQYRMYVEYDFIGPYTLQRRVRERMTEQANAWLPLGYTAEATGWGGWSRQAERKQYALIFLVIGIIYFICAILLESLLQPLAVIAMIPLSFIGLFLTFYLFEFNFDQGGYAALLVLSGISVNAALYLIDEYNRLRAQARRAATPAPADARLYWQAFRHKIVPIGLTIMSTVLGFIPFLWAGPDEPFWFTLAAGTIGGLLFSIIAIGVYLPLFILKRSSYAPPPTAEKG